MSYSNPNVKITYENTGAQLSFSVNFYYLEGDDVIIAELWDYTNPDSPTKQSFVKGVDYTIDESNYPDTEVVLASPIPTDHKLVIYRSTNAIQTTNFVNGSFPAESVEESLDRNMMVAQEVQDAISRALILPIAGPTITIEDVLSAVSESLVLESRVDAVEAVNATQTSNINTNAGNIATNTSSITSLSGNVVLATTPSSVVTLNSSDKCVVKASSVTLDLPATPTVNSFVIVKNRGDYSPVINGNGNNIDGLATYTLESSDSSVYLLFDGIEWIIL